MIASLGRRDGDPGRLAAIQRAFSRRNPGYALDHHRGLGRLAPAELTRAVFVQDCSPAARVTISGADVTASSEVTMGDVLLVRPGHTLRSDGRIGALVFTVPSRPADHLPEIIRPDSDPRITDTPGGCATDAKAYRRICLTWLPESGPYVWHALNAHRVLITDSFSHYHPLEGGFDEFYLVQGLRPGAHLVTSSKVAAIESPETLDASRVRDLLKTHDLAVGDLVYLPRGVMHRGLGGVLAQVITVAGFRPGAEIGVDHHLRAINERLGLGKGEALPYHAAAGARAVVK